jgi:hypothetical protein
MSDMRCTRIGLSLVLLSTLSLAAPRAVWGQDEPPVKHGRKYKAPPDTSHVEVTVTRHSNGKPIVNAAVVFNPSKDGKDEGNLEVKTDPEGKAIIDVIPTGSTVRIQIIAEGYATYADDYVIAEPSRQIAVSMLRPQEQISTYENNKGKAATRPVGVQEPAKPPAKPATPPAPPAQTNPPQPAPQQ